TSARDAHFQAYLLEGLMRWNQDRMEEAVRGNSELRTYSRELLGMEYLYSQSGQSLTVMDNPEEEDRLVEQLDDEVVNDEGFVEEELEDLTVPVLYEPFGTVPLYSSIPQASNPSSSAPS
ncbi:hypothetical protein GOODEAATRI_028672, partial [Goodea atripinnis]